MIFCISSLYDFFKEQSGDEPQRCVIKADQSVDIVLCMAVIPWAGAVPSQKTSGEEFSRKDTAGIDNSSDQKITLPQQTAQRCQKTGHTVDRKHPDRSMGCQFVLIFPQGSKPRKYNFHAPSHDAAHNKLLPHHKESMHNRSRFYTGNILYCDIATSAGTVERLSAARSRTGFVLSLCECNNSEMEQSGIELLKRRADGGKA